MDGLDRRLKLEIVWNGIEKREKWGKGEGDKSEEKKRCYVRIAENVDCIHVSPSLLSLAV